MVIDISKLRYPHIGWLMGMQPNPHLVLGKKVFWTCKEDGTQIGLYLDENDELQVRSKNKKVAAPDIYQAFVATGLGDDAKEMLLSARDWNSEYVLYGELMRRGKSPTYMEVHPETQFVAFDLWDQKEGGLLNYNGAYQRCYHHNIPFVKLYATSYNTTIEGLFETKNKILDKAIDEGKEGAVGKWWGDGEVLYFKDKRDLPRYDEIPHFEEGGMVQLPLLPDSEIYGAINTCCADIGIAKFRDIRIAMPLIAKQYVPEQCKLHNCQMPKNRPLIEYYHKWLRDMYLK